jgi:hypothetical protein
VLKQVIINGFFLVRLALYLSENNNRWNNDGVKKKMELKFGFMQVNTFFWVIVSNIILIAEVVMDSYAPGMFPEKLKQVPKPLTEYLAEAVSRNQSNAVEVLLERLEPVYNEGEGEEEFIPILRKFPTRDKDRGIIEEGIIHWAIRHCYPEIVEAIMDKGEKIEDFKGIVDMALTQIRRDG